MNIIHIRKDGTVTDSIEGTIPDGEFYEVLRSILFKEEIHNA